MSLTKLSPDGNNSVIPHESLVSDIPAGDGKTGNFFTVYKSAKRCERVSERGIGKTICTFRFRGRKVYEKTLLYYGVYRVQSNIIFWI